MSFALKIRYETAEIWICFNEADLSEPTKRLNYRMYVERIERIAMSSDGSPNVGRLIATQYNQSQFHVLIIKHIEKAAYKSQKNKTKKAGKNVSKRRRYQGNDSRNEEILPETKSITKTKITQ